MKCSETAWLSDKEYLEQFSRKAFQLRIPLSGGIDLSSRCNLKCVHCYFSTDGETAETGKAELDTGRILSIIDEITEAGCLYLLITGGEPLMRKDFSTIYRHAKLNGLLTTVFTNGTLVTEHIAGLFEELPPQAVEISLYGATASTYENISGVKGSYEKCLAGIRRLLDHHIQVKLKTVLMTLNIHEFTAMENIAKKFGIPFRFDAALFPRFNGDKAPLKLRVSPEAAVDKEFADLQRLNSYRDYFKRVRDFPVSDSLYICSAGLTNFHIDANGNLKPCLMTHDIRYSLLSGNFLNGWEKVIPKILSKKADGSYICNACDKRALCGVCPAFFRLENGSEYIRSAYLCEMGEHRFQKIHNGFQGG